MSGPYVFQDTPELRLATLQLAVEFYKDNTVDTDDVIDAAKEFLNFILKPE